MLKLSENAVKLLFNGLTLYISKQNNTIQPFYEYEGENNRYILMLYSREGGRTLPGDKKAFLEKILGSVKMTFKDIALMNIAGTQPVFEELRGFFAPMSVFLWGIDPKMFGIKADKYQPVLYASKVKVIFIDSLDDIEKNAELKAKLWSVLKAHYLQ